jgi:hypothetical protein
VPSPPEVAPDAYRIACFRASPSISAQRRISDGLPDCFEHAGAEAPQRVIGRERIETADALEGAVALIGRPLRQRQGLVQQLLGRTTLRRRLGARNPRPGFVECHLQHIIASSQWLR